MCEIEFEGKIVKPMKNGYYKCPYKCGRADYPQPKWKTESGFRRHMETCTGKPSAVKARTEKAEDVRKKYDEIKAQVLGSLEYKVGDVVCYVKETIVKGTHEWRGERRVRVRYEAVKKFEARQAEITSIDFADYPMVPTVEYARTNLLRFNKHISLLDLATSLDAAKIIAEAKQKAYDDHVEFSKSVR